MVAVVGSLAVALEADKRQFGTALKAAGRDVTELELKANRSLRRMDTSTRGSFSRMARSTGLLSRATDGAVRSFSTFAKVYATVKLAQGAQAIVDSSIKINNALKVAGLQGDDLKKVYDSLYASAQRNAVPLEALSVLYGRASQSAADLGANQETLLKFTDGIAVALKVSGQSATESAGALLQLSQALGDGKVQAEEYNSLLDGGRTILQAVAAGMDQAGGKVSALTRLVKAGKVSSKAFFDAFLAGLPVLQDKVANSETTISGHFVRLQNALTDAARRFDTSSEAVDSLGSAMDSLAGFIDKIDFNALISGLNAFLARVDAGISKIDQLASSLGSLTGLDRIGEAVTGGKAQVTYFKGTPFETTVTSTKAVEDRINGAFANAGAQGGGALTPDAIRAAAEGKPAPKLPSEVKPAAPAVKPITLADYPVTGSKGSKSGSRSSRNDLQSEIRQIQERTKALDAMTEAQASVNPLVDDYGFAIAKARAKQDLLNAAEKAGIEITPALREKIDTLATGYANAQAASEKLAQSQDEVRRRAEDMRELGKDVLSGFVSDLVHGKSAADALADALGKMADKLLSAGLDRLFGGLGGGGGAFFGDLSTTGLFS